MKPRRATRGHPLAQARPSTTEAICEPPSEDPVAQALNRMAKVLLPITGTTHRDEHRLETEGDQALKKYLEFCPPQFYGKPNSEQETEAWIDQMEDIFTALNYADQKKVQFATFIQQGPARDWWLRKKEVYKREQREWI
jgi:hypothetical protein